MEAEIQLNPNSRRVVLRKRLTAPPSHYHSFRYAKLLICTLAKLGAVMTSHAKLSPPFLSKLSEIHDKQCLWRKKRSCSFLSIIRFFVRPYTKYRSDLGTELQDVVCAISKTCDWSDAQNVIGYNNNNHYNGGEVALSK